MENIKVTKETIRNVIVNELEHVEECPSGKSLDVAINVLVAHYKTVSKALASTLDKIYLSSAVLSEYIKEYTNDIKFVTSKDYPAIARLVWNHIWSELVTIDVE